MFNENNTTQRKITDTLKSLSWREILAKELNRSIRDVFLTEDLVQALVKLNPEIAAQPSRAEEVVHRLRGILLSVHHDGLVHANEKMAAWLHNDITMPFGPNHQHVPVRLIDYDNLNNNSYIVAEEVTFKPAKIEKRFDHVLFVNGMPLVVGEAKTPVRKGWSWFDGALQVQGYERTVPEFFVPNVFSFASEGKLYRYGSIQAPLQHWGPWYDSDQPEEEVEGLAIVAENARAMLQPRVVLDLLRHFTTYATNKQGRMIKIIARYQQYYTALKIARRVLLGKVRKGLIWHFQGSGKSLLMLFTAQLLRSLPQLQKPTVLIIVDRVDLDTQISGTFLANDVANVVTTDNREELHTLLRTGVRKIIITTIHKFAEADEKLNDSPNIIVMVDEAHRTQEGDLGQFMRDALPNAFLFGLTGTPINKRDRNTFYAFGAEEDESGYLDRYSFTDSIRDKATLPLKFETRLVELHVNQEAITEAYAQMTGHLSEEDQANLAKMAANIAVLIKAPSRVEKIVADIVTHYQEKIAPNRFKAMVVTFDRESCLAYKTAMDMLLPAEASDIIMSVNSKEDEYKPFARSKDQEESILDNFRNPDHPLKFLIVTAKLLTGFDAPILQAMYLDKPIKEHNLLQAICRTNRVYPRRADAPEKTHGLIVDYVGVFDDVAKSLRFDEEEMRRVVENIEALKAQLPEAMDRCLAYFPDVDRTVSGYEGLEAAQERLRDDDIRDEFRADYSVLGRLWDAISPEHMLKPYYQDYRWLSQVYESVQPSTGHGQMIWYTLGPKTLEIIHDNISVYDVRDDLDTLVMDADFLARLLDQRDPIAQKELEVKLIRRLRNHANDNRFIALGIQLETLRQRHEQGILTSIEFLKMLLKVARDVVRIERAVEVEQEAIKTPEEEGLSALTELFREVQGDETPKMVERIVTDIDEIVRIVRFPNWQTTKKGERLVKMELRRTLAKYQLHKDNDLFERAYGYIAEYY
ncbi:MAG TPA: type I restriction endonuclease subunit R [Anaerolineae bacterium]|nr:type I restriction endonuclease subunit R [Anaerolineae bacterium]